MIFSGKGFEPRKIVWLGVEKPNRIKAVFELTFLDC